MNEHERDLDRDPAAGDEAEERRAFEPIARRLREANALIEPPPHLAPRIAAALDGDSRRRRRHWRAWAAAAAIVALVLTAWALWSLARGGTPVAPHRQIAGEPSPRLVAPSPDEPAAPKTTPREPGPARVELATDGSQFMRQVPTRHHNVTLIVIYQALPLADARAGEREQPADGDSSS